MKCSLNIWFYAHNHFETDVDGSQTNSDLYLEYFFIITVKQNTGYINQNCLLRIFVSMFQYIYCYTHFRSFAERLSDFIVSVSNVSFPVTADDLVPPAFTQCGQYDGYPGSGQTGTLTCSPGPSRGRYVFISLPAIESLTLCEVRFFAGLMSELVCQKQVSRTGANNYMLQIYRYCWM